MTFMTFSPGELCVKLLTRPLEVGPFGFFLDYHGEFYCWGGGGLGNRGY